MRWKDVKIGDVVLVQNEEFFPADLVILGSSDPKGTAFIMTSSLDGEKNLKPRMSIKEVQQFYSNPDRVSFVGEVSCAPPSNDLSEFQGTLKLNEKQFGLSSK